MRAPLLAAVLLLLSLGGSTLAGDPPVRLLQPEEAGYRPYLRAMPTGTAGRLDWLLVTTKELAPAFEPLVRHRRDLGLAAGVVTVEEIAADALLGGGDFPERLRSYVREMHRLFGMRYLVLAADSELLPSRMVPMGLSGEQVHYGELFAAEAYFGCLDGEWNADADALFAEAEPGNDDRPDLEHEVHVGRIPVESIREAETFVTKLLLYERPIFTDYLSRITYLGGKVFVEDDADRHYRQIHEELFAPRGLTARFFTKAGEDAAHGKVFAALSEGAGIVCHYHHSFTYNLSLPTGAIDTGNYLEIANRERPFVMFSNGCYANQFTKEGISEKLLLSPEGGPAAFLGSTNTCFSSSLVLEKRFWEELLSGRTKTLGEALSAMRFSVKQGVGAPGFLRLSLNLLGDPATVPWIGAPVRVGLEAEAGKDGTLKVTRKGDAPGRLFASCVQDGRFGAWREPLEFEAGGESVTFLPVVGNGRPVRVTIHGKGVVPVSAEVPDPVPVRIEAARLADRALALDLRGAKQASLELPLPVPSEPGVVVRLEEMVEGYPVRVRLPVLDGSDRTFVHRGGTVRLPGFARMGVPPVPGSPLVTAGEPRPVEGAVSSGKGPPEEIEVLTTDSEIGLSWKGEPGARWMVERESADGKPTLLTPIPLVNPVFTMTGLPPLTQQKLTLYRLGENEGTEVTATTSFPFQRGFPQRIGANVTSVQVLDLDGKRGLEVLFGDDKLGLWALHDDGSEVRHAGDNWTFGLFAAIESGVFEPVVYDLSRKHRGGEILATSKLKDRKLYAFSQKGELLPGFPVSFASRLMTPPLVGEFDGKRGDEILVVSGFGKKVELVRPDGTKEPYAEIGQYNYGYPVAANLDRDKALEVVILDGSGKVWALDQGGKPMKGFPVDLGGPGRATPMLADLDGKRGLEIVAVGKGTTELAVISPKGGEVLARLTIPDSGEPANDSFFYPGIADLGGEGKVSIVVGTPSKKLFAFDLTKEEGLVVREKFPIDLPAEARGIAAVDVTGDKRDELFLSLHNGEVWGLSPDGEMLEGFPLVTKADTYSVPLLDDLDGDGDLELFLGAADGVLRVWDLPYEIGRRTPTWRGLLNGAGMPGVPGR